MRSIVVTEPGRVEIVELPDPHPKDYEVRVKTEAACLCNATDSKLVAGEFPGVDSYPLTLGHESVGIVDALGDKARNFNLGDRVIGGLLFDAGDPRYATGWGGFCEYTLAVDHDAMVEDGVADEEHGWFEVYEIQRTVPPNISVEAAVLLCTWREVLGAFGDFHLQKGDNVLIIGGGPVGLSFVKLGRLFGLGYIGLVDSHPFKREKAIAMGANEAFSRDDDLDAIVKRRGEPFDVVIDAVGSGAIVNSAISLIKMGGTIGVYGVIGEDTVPIQKSRGPYNFNLLVHQWPTRHREHAAQKPLCTWLNEGKLAAEEFLTHEFPMEKVNDALDAVKRREVIKAMLRY